MVFNGSVHGSQLQSRNIVSESVTEQNCLAHDGQEEEKEKSIRDKGVRDPT